MSNNHYTSPRVYASRGYKPKYKTKRTHYEQGIGYLEPSELGISRAEFKKLYNQWEEKLKASGFDDIEYRSPTHTGHFTPFFRVNGSTATFMRMYDSSTEEYYRLTRHFDSYMNEVVDGGAHTRWSKAFYGHTLQYKTLWYLHIEGVPYRAVARAFSGKPDKWVKGLTPVHASLIQSRSVFWAHNHTAKIMDLFWQWAATFETGFADPRAVKAEGTTMPAIASVPDGHTEE